MSVSASKTPSQRPGRASCGATRQTRQETRKNSSLPCPSPVRGRRARVRFCQQNAQPRQGRASCGPLGRPGKRPEKTAPCLAPLARSRTPRSCPFLPAKHPANDKAELGCRRYSEDQARDQKKQTPCPALPRTRSRTPRSCPFLPAERLSHNQQGSAAGARREKNAA